MNIQKRGENNTNFKIEEERLERAFQDYPSRKRKGSYGLCSACKCFKLQVSEFGGDRSWCDMYYELPDGFLSPNRTDPIVECSNYYPKGQMDLNQMLEIAVIIEIQSKKVGFIDDKEIVFKYPDKKKDDDI